MANKKLPIDRDEVRKRKERFAELMGQGLSYIQAGKQIGVMSETGAKQYRDDPFVQNILKKVHNENIKELQMTRGKVQDIVMEAIEMARVLADPLAIIRGAQEINKMCGFYAPEEKRVILTSEQRRTISQFDDMSDEEIARVAESGVIEAEFTEIEEGAG